MRIKFLILFVLSTFCVSSQELKAVVSINSDQVTSVNTQIFKNLEKQVFDFLNNTKFSDKETKLNEKVNCSFFFIINKFEANNFEVTLQVNSTRPVFNSTFTTPILNINDKDVSFKYIEFENLVYDKNSFTSNLVSVLSFYANIVLASDADTFSDKGGSEYLESALNIANVAQPSGFSGWVQTGKKTTRYNLISDLMSNTFDAYRETLYQYHINGLDKMADDLKTGKFEIMNAIETLLKLHKVRPNSLLARTFFDAKTDELVNIFSGGPVMDISKVKDNLATISPLNSSKWNKIR
ncbi:DUF4835 family protein [Flavobacterium sp. F372]|jgi:hypothetical protein|uniref:DUF4835 family protein n=1 Tax=Flavobacterium bernardetii TaxID=2813823 RepID=A0ABR7IXG9_9FLAO|nr:DUF4835 family protein [Flavobacterium bernardetii]MBC5834227.1 DUF4835 family protein [Flavobacterium bernardetii]NHF70134.1 DUF4835 family protein [Flavobacterium bernardetii]